ncbi:hypothetical protein LTR36_008723 [Oleoguttula mirabilis]|uniref:Uncharacterized protein n=1 Tax=Oleoguttula mirabilis TaxID=1507867 RepID=A0AAV9JTU5_9PEZI|nr:hypothetical protein LTR36_008723 [Oleoguttula mirabilis]
MNEVVLVVWQPQQSNDRERQAPTDSASTKEQQPHMFAYCSRDVKIDLSQMFRKHHFPEVHFAVYYDLVSKMGLDLTENIWTPCDRNEHSHLHPDLDCQAAGTSGITCFYEDGGPDVHHVIVPMKKAVEGVAILLNAAVDPGLTQNALREEIVRGLRLMVCEDHSNAQADLWRRAPVLEEVIMVWRDDVQGAELQRVKDGKAAEENQSAAKTRRICALEAALVAGVNLSAAEEDLSAEKTTKIHALEAALAAEKDLSEAKEDLSAAKADLSAGKTTQIRALEAALVIAENLSAAQTRLIHALDAALAAEKSAASSAKAAKDIQDGEDGAEALGIPSGVASTGGESGGLTMGSVIMGIIAILLVYFGVELVKAIA